MHFPFSRFPALLLVFVFLLTQAIMGLSANALADDGPEDWYPFFSWFLFDEAPARLQTGYVIRFTDEGGVTHIYPAPAAHVEDFRETPLSYHLVENFGRAVTGGQEEAVSRMLPALEAAVAPRSDAFTLFRVVYNPVEYWKNGTVRSEEEMRAYAIRH